jgi:phosphoserine phosphatase RsbU/P
LSVVQAAHPPLLHAPRGQSARAIDLEGDVLGVFDNAVFGQQELTVKAGDRLYLYSDGLIEADHARAADHRLGLARLREAIDRHRERPLAESVDAVVADVLDGTRPADDIVLLGVEV